MDSHSEDNVITLIAIGLLAYLSADVGHHVLGHGATCLALGGKINLLSSIYVDCTLRGSAIDLAGPFANFIIGVVAILIRRMMTPASPTVQLFLSMVMAFNLFWFALQLAFSAATRTDDWAWAMQELHIAKSTRYSMIVVGLLTYYLTIRTAASQMAAFATPLPRIRAIVLTAWLAAGGIACITAAFDTYPATALKQAIPQSLGLSIGLLLVSSQIRKVKSTDNKMSAIPKSATWINSAIIAGAASILLLGPGISISL